MMQGYAVLGMAALVLSGCEDAARPVDVADGAGRPVLADGRAFNEFDILKGEATPRGKEIVQVTIRDQKTETKRSLSAEITCHGQSGPDKARDVVDSLNAKLPKELVGKVSFGAEDFGEGGLGLLQGGITPFAEGLVFTAVSSTPCKDGEEQETDAVTTPEPRTSFLRLRGETSRLQLPDRNVLSLLVDDVEVSTFTNGKSRSSLLRELASSLIGLGREAQVRDNTLFIPGTRKIQATTTEPRLQLTFGVQST